MAVQGTLFLRWKKRGIEPRESTASRFEVAVVRIGDRISVVGKLDERPFDMTASPATGVQIKHVEFRENRLMTWVGSADHVSVELADSGKGFLVRFNQTIAAITDGAYQIREGSVIGYED